MQQSLFITIGNEKLHYLKSGVGKKLVLGFHGYGNDAAHFNSIVPYLENSCTLLSFDLPHHGKSNWGHQPFSRQILIQLIKNILMQYNVEKMSLLGFSMGGRVCLTIIEMMPDAIDKVTLVAPDGLVFNTPYYLATSNIFGRNLFKYIIYKPSLFFKLADFLLKVKLVDPSRHKFVTQYLRTEASRSFLDKVWNTSAEIVPNLRKLKQEIRSFKIPIIIYLGEFDRIILTQNGVKFRKNLETVRLNILPKGHRVLDNQTSEEIAQSLF